MPVLGCLAFNRRPPQSVLWIKGKDNVTKEVHILKIDWNTFSIDCETLAILSDLQRKKVPHFEKYDQKMFRHELQCQQGILFSPEIPFEREGESRFISGFGKDSERYVGDPCIWLLCREAVQCLRANCDLTNELSL